MICFPGMKKDLSYFFYSCLTLQKSKIEYQKSSRWMQPLSIPEWNLDSIFIDFVTGFPKIAKGSDLIWVVIDIMTILSHFNLIKISYLLQKLVKICISVIVKLHGISPSIILDRDQRFTSRIWESLQEALGTKLRFISSYHPYMNG